MVDQISVNRKQDRMAQIHWSIKAKRLEMVGLRASMIAEVSHQLKLWKKDEIPDWEMSDGSSFDGLLKRASLLGESLQKSNVRLLEAGLGASEASTLLQVWSNDLKDSFLVAAKIIVWIDVSRNMLKERLDEAAFERIQQEYDTRYGVRSLRFSLSRVMNGLGSDLRYAGKLLSEVERELNPQTESDRVRRHRMRSRMGFSRVLVNVHDSDIETMARMGLIDPGEKDKAAIEAAAETVLSAALTNAYVSDGASLDGLKGLLDRINDLNTVDQNVKPEEVR